MMTPGWTRARLGLIAASTNPPSASSQPGPRPGPAPRRHQRGVTGPDRASSRLLATSARASLGQLPISSF